MAEYLDGSNSALEIGFESRPNLRLQKHNSKRNLEASDIVLTKARFARSRESIKEGKRPINASGQFSGTPPWWKTATLKRPFKRGLCVLSTHPKMQAVSAFCCIPLFTSGFSAHVFLARNPKQNAV